MNELIIDGKRYLSSKAAAEITGYAKDYVGQLCREGHVEAKMVGRSWYVLETAIQAHRFGTATTGLPEDTHVAMEVVPKEDPYLPSMWVPSVYKHEVVDTIPEVQRKEEALTDTRQENSSKETLSDMQEAWKEWFSKKQTNTYIESPEVIEHRQVEHDLDTIQETLMEDIEEKTVPVAEEEEITRVPLHRIEEREEAQEVPVTKVLQGSGPEKRSFIREEKALVEDIRVSIASNKVSGISSLVVNAVLFGVCGIVVGVMLIGSGYGGNYLHWNSTVSSILNFIEGERVYSR
jgi:hypothetical protein